MSLFLSESDLISCWLSESDIMSWLLSESDLMSWWISESDLMSWWLLERYRYAIESMVLDLCNRGRALIAVLKADLVIDLYRLAAIKTLLAHCFDVPCCCCCCCGCCQREAE